MKKLLTLLFATSLVACELPAPPNGAPTPTPYPSASVSPSPSPSPSKVATPGSVNAIRAIVEGSKACSAYSWKNRGRAPFGYTHGMALAYAQSVCKGRQVMAQDVGNAAKDALAWIAPNVPLATASDRLLANYTLLLGLGMRESSGNYCEGPDASVPVSKQTADTAEAGLFQQSYNLMPASNSLTILYSEYRENRGQCLLEAFKEGAKCREQPIIGGGMGAEFQRFTRACPAFAAEHAASGLRVARSHWGPINRKEVEFNAECYEMLKKVRDVLVCAR